MVELWTHAASIASLRQRLSDGPGDKFVHLADVDPEPDGQTRNFAVPDSRLVSGSLKVFLNGVELTPLTIDLVGGSFEMDAPDEGQSLKATYYFQWFEDAQLQQFITQSSRLIRYEDAEDPLLPPGLRTPVLGFASYYAYMKKAAEAAAAIVASSSGFTSDNSQEHPNWLGLAKLAWDTAKQELEAFAQNSATDVSRPSMRFTSFRLPRYTPRT